MDGDIRGVDDSQAIVFRRLDDDEDTEERLRNELLQMQRIRGLDMEQREMEEADSEASLSLSDNDSRFSPLLIYPLCFLSSLYFSIISLDLVIPPAQRPFEVISPASIANLIQARDVCGTYSGWKSTLSYSPCIVIYLLYQLHCY